MHGFFNAGYLVLFSLLNLIVAMFLWFKDITSEGTFLGNHTNAVQRGLNLGFGLFVVSEVLFFLAIF
jgi:cytochrome c oxidase subunit 3